MVKAERWTNSRQRPVYVHLESHLSQYLLVSTKSSSTSACVSKGFVECASSAAVPNRFAPATSSVNQLVSSIKAEDNITEGILFNSSSTLFFCDAGGSRRTNVTLCPSVRTKSAATPRPL